MLLILGIFLNYPLGINVFGLPLTTQKVTMIIAIILLIPKLMYGSHPISRLITPITFPFAFLIIIATLSSLQAKYPQASFQGLITLLLIVIGIHIIYFLIQISDPVRIRQVLSIGITVIFFVFSALVIFYFLKEGNLVRRLSGTFANPNEFGAMVLMIIPIILAGMEREDMKFTLLGGISCILVLVVIYLTYSRATYLATFFLIGVITVGNLVYPSSKQKSILNKKMWLGILIIIILGFLMYKVLPSESFEFGVERYQSTFANGKLNLGASSIRKRYSAIWVALKLFWESPFLGIGMKNFNAYSIALLRVGLMPATENTYLNVLTELGLFAFAVFLYILYCIFRKLLENKKQLKDDYLQSLNKYLTYSFITFLFMMMTNDFLYDIRVFWLWAIIIISLQKLDERLTQYTVEKVEVKDFNRI
jgi:O-antigen ligase